MRCAVGGNFLETIMHGASRMIDPSTSREVRDPLWQRAIVLLSGTVVGLVLVIVLIWDAPSSFRSLWPDC